jgi:HK97 gp10 family phage protein
MRGKAVRVQGIDKVLRRLRVLPDKLQRKVIRGAVSKSTTLVARDARKRIPKGTGTNEQGVPRKHLKNSIKTKTKTYKNTGTIVGVVGADKTAFHAHLVHNGTAPHTTVLTRPLVLNNVVLPAGFAIPHPGAKANPFLDDAIKATRGRVQAKLSKEIIAGLEREVKKLAKSG